MRREDAFLAVAPALGHGADAGDGLDPVPAPHIARSWERCRAMNVIHREPAPLPSSELADRRESASLLWRCAQPELDAMTEHLDARGCVVLLADAHGLVLDTSDEALCGTDWSEAARGTNAIGTALHEKAPLQVAGREHFLLACSAFAGTAAPVLDARGQLAGVLALWTHAPSIDAQAAALAQMAAAQIEHRMLERTHASERVHFHRRPALLGTWREGLLLVEQGRIVGMNRIAACLLGGDIAGWLDQPVEEVLGERWQRLIDQPGLVSAPDGLPWAVSVDSRRTRRTRAAAARRGGSRQRQPGSAVPQADACAASAEQAQPAPPARAATLSQMRREAMTLALARHGGHIAPAARRLGVGRSTLYRWLRGDPPGP